MSQPELLSPEQINNEAVISEFVKTLAALELIFNIEKVNLPAEMDDLKTYLDEFLFPLSNMWRDK